MSASISGPAPTRQSTTDRKENRSMRRIVATEYLSLDGVMEEPGEWSMPFFNQEAGQFKSDELFASDAMLLGRLTYEGFAAAWPSMTDTGEFGEKMNGMPKYVVTNTLESPEWTNTSVLRGGAGLAAEVNGLKEQFEGDILVAGSAQLVQSLLALDLVDELHLMVFPVVLGDGKKLFGEGAELPLELAETRQTGDVAILTLRRKRD